MRNVIIVGIHRGMNEVEPLDIKQECGRAGRVGLDDRGDAYILLPENKFSYYKSWCENIPPIVSTLNNQDILAFHIVSEISEGEVKDVATLMSWYNRSLAAFQNNFLDRIEAEKLLENLEKFYIIKKFGKYYKITNLGRIASNLYFSPYSIAGWYLNFNKIFKNEKQTDTAISWALANIIENNSKNYVPKDLVPAVTSYIQRCKSEGLDIANGSALIGFCYECCLTYSDAVPFSQKRNIQFDTERVITALRMIQDRCAFWKIKRNSFWEKLEMRIKYEISWEQTSLCSLKGIGGVYVRQLFESDIKKISDFRNVQNQGKLENILGKKRYQKILEENHLKGDNCD